MDDSATEPRHDSLRPKWLDLATGSLEVHTPEGQSFADVRDERFLSFLEARFGRRLRLLFDPAGVYDSGILISIISTQTIAKLGEEASLGSLRKERFRANLYADWLDLPLPSTRTSWWAGKCLWARI